MKTCSNCGSTVNRFPLFPELFKGMETWCFTCIHEYVEYEYKTKQAEGFFTKLAQQRRDTKYEAL